VYLEVIQSTNIESADHERAGARAIRSLESTNDIKGLSRGRVLKEWTMKTKIIQ
jgi:hypothetical protein